LNKKRNEKDFEIQRRATSMMVIELKVIEVDCHGIALKKRALYLVL